ncbi:MAG: DeoR/GlpR transcriptional regulator [Caldilineae bacterium]|nr:MAG: DeoR/GlpR transcriptional regulator [Caldilineae bacterium]
MTEHTHQFCQIIHVGHAGTSCLRNKGSRSFEIFRKPLTSKLLWRIMNLKEYDTDHSRKRANISMPRVQSGAEHASVLSVSSCFRRQRAASLPSILQVSPGVGKEHRLAQRRQAILMALKEKGQVTVAELSERFGVSEVTIRADLQALYEQGLLLRTRGGAMATKALPELSFDVRKQQRSRQKARIGKAAAHLIHSGDTIALDASTTAQAIIPHIKHLAELNVVTNSLRVAMSLLDAPQVHVMLPGGHLRRESISLVGQEGCEFFEDININVGFFGARGITLEEGFTDVNLEEVHTKRAMVTRCKKVVIVADASKWGQVATTTFAPVERVDTVITDTDAPVDLVAEMRRRGVEVILA